MSWWLSTTQLSSGQDNASFLQQDLNLHSKFFLYGSSQTPPIPHLIVTKTHKDINQSSYIWPNNLGVAYSLTQQWNPLTIVLLELTVKLKDIEWPNPKSIIHETSHLQFLFPDISLLGLHNFFFFKFKLLHGLDLGSIWLVFFINSAHLTTFQASQFCALYYNPVSCPTLGVSQREGYIKS